MRWYVVLAPPVLEEEWDDGEMYEIVRPPTVKCMELEYFEANLPRPEVSFDSYGNCKVLFSPDMGPSAVKQLAREAREDALRAIAERVHHNATE